MPENEREPVTELGLAREAECPIRTRCESVHDEDQGRWKVLGMDRESNVDPERRVRNGRDNELLPNWHGAKDTRGDEGE